MTTTTRNPSGVMDACAIEGFTKGSAACLVQSALDLESIESDMRSSIAYLERELARAVRSLDAGQHVNSLGICQSTAVTIDRQAALRAAKIDEIKRLAYMGAAGVHDDPEDAHAASSAIIEVILGAK